MRISLERLVVAIVVSTAAYQAGIQNAHAADARSPGQGNPLDNLPKVELAPSPSVTVDIQEKGQDPALQRLLAARITPSRFQIAGVKAVPFELVAEKFSGLTNKEVTVAELIQAANKITDLYREKGYPLSFAFIPAQSFKDNIVVINVVEGYVDKVTIKGNPGASEQRLVEIAEQLKSDRPLSNDTFERVTAILGMQPGMRIEATVQPPVTTDGAAEMILNVKRKPITASMGLDTATSNLRGIFNVSTNSLTSLGEQISLSALAPRGSSHEQYFGAAYSQPISKNGMLLSVTLSDYKAEPENKNLPAQQFEQRYQTSTRRVAANLSYPLILKSSQSLTLTGGVYAVENSSRYTRSVPATPSQIELSSDIRAVSLEMAWVKAAQKYSTQASIGLYQGIDGAGADKKNSDVDLDFLRIRGQFTQTNVLPAGFGIVVSGSGQYSSNVLALSEQIGFGAKQFGLAYPAGEIAGDKGWGLSLELNRSYPIGDVKYLKQVQPYILADAAQVSSNSALIAKSDIASLGLGVRFGDQRHYLLDLSVAKPVGDIPVNADDRALRLNLSYSYQLD